EGFATEGETLEPLEREIRIDSEDAPGAAQQLLAKGRVTKPPVAVEKLARLCGVHVQAAPFRDSVSGVLLDLEVGPIIGYNATHAPGRQRFSIAHELGHFLLSH